MSKEISTLSTNNKEKALEFFNDVPWWMEEVASHNDSEKGGFWGLESVGEAVPAIFITLVVIVTASFGVNSLFGLLPAIIVGAVTIALFIIIPAAKARNTSRYMVTHTWENDKRVVRYSEKTLFGEKTTVKSYTTINMRSHVKSFDRLLEE